jgi:sugar phosphate isomerase/epimerase
MHFGVCAGPEDAGWIRDAGADYIECHAQKVLAPNEEDWQPPADVALPIAAYNCFLPGSLKVTGPEVDLARLEAYARTAMARARQTGAEIMVFGSGGARRVPDDWPREKAEEQLVEAIRIAGRAAEDEGMVVAMEPLRSAESNILNTVAEGVNLVERADAPGLAVLCDFYHLAVEDEPIENLEGAKDMLVHCHVAEPEGRVAPAPGGTDLKPWLAKLKAVGYDARVSIECGWDDFRSQLGPALDFLRREWEAA